MLCHTAHRILTYITCCFVAHFTKQLLYTLPAHYTEQVVYIVPEPNTTPQHIALYRIALHCLTLTISLYKQLQPLHHHSTPANYNGTLNICTLHHTSTLHYTSTQQQHCTTLAHFTTLAHNNSTLHFGSTLVY